MRLAAILVLAAAAMVAHPVALAGRSCDAEKPPSARTVERGLQLAERVHHALEAQHAANGAHVVVLARAGQDLSRYGLTYSHFGLAYRTSLTDGRAAWRVLHKLNHCGSAEAAIYRQGLGEFFLDDPWRFEAAWVVPEASVQAKLAALIADPQRSVRLHHRPYSTVSYAWGVRYQQSNQWLLETLASAMEPGIASRDRAQAWLRYQGYEPTTLKLGALTRLGGRVSRANVAFDDHPNEKRFSDRIETVTVDSVFAWMERNRLASAPKTLRL